MVIDFAAGKNSADDAVFLCGQRRTPFDKGEVAEILRKLGTAFVGDSMGKLLSFGCFLVYNQKNRSIKWKRL